VKCLGTHQGYFPDPSDCDSIDPMQLRDEISRRGERWARLVVRTVTEIVKIVSQDGTLRYARPALERVFVCDPDEAMGMNILGYVYPEYSPHVLEETQKGMGKTGVGRNVAVFGFRHKYGFWRQMEGVGAYMWDEPAVGA
jgi:hypothetical protein